MFKEFKNRVWPFDKVKKLGIENFMESALYDFGGARKENRKTWVLEYPQNVDDIFNDDIRSMVDYLFMDKRKKMVESLGAIGGSWVYDTEQRDGDLRTNLVGIRITAIDSGWIWTKRTVKVELRVVHLFLTPNTVELRGL